MKRSSERLNWLRKAAQVEDSCFVTAISPELFKLMNKKLAKAKKNVKKGNENDKK